MSSAVNHSILPTLVPLVQIIIPLAIQPSSAVPVPYIPVRLPRGRPLEDDEFRTVMDARTCWVEEDTINAYDSAVRERDVLQAGRNVIKAERVYKEAEKAHEEAERNIWYAGRGPDRLRENLVHAERALAHATRKFDELESGQGEGESSIEDSSEDDSAGEEAPLERPSIKELSREKSSGKGSLWEEYSAGKSSSSSSLEKEEEELSIIKPERISAATGKAKALPLRQLTQKHSSLMMLPIEIRFLIYDILATKDTVQILNPHSQKGLLLDFSNTCHKSQEEVEQWYRNNTKYGVTGTRFTGGYVPRGLKWVLDLRGRMKADWDIAFNNEGEYEKTTEISLPSPHGYWVRSGTKLDIFFPIGFDESTSNIWRKFHSDSNLSALEHLIVDFRDTLFDDSNPLLDHWENVGQSLSRFQNLKTVEFIVDQPEDRCWRDEWLCFLPIVFMGELDSFQVRAKCTACRYEDVVKYEQIVVRKFPATFYYMLHEDLLEDGVKESPVDRTVELTRRSISITD